MAKKYKENPNCLAIPKFRILFLICVIGMGLTGFAGIKGGVWKLYNDIPSMVGYTSLSLIIYKIGIPFVNRFFEFTNKVSYEWYLVHILVFSCTRYLADDYITSNWIIAVLSLVLSYLIAYLYHMILRFLKIG